MLILFMTLESNIFMASTFLPVLSVEKKIHTFESLEVETLYLA